MTHGGQVAARRAGGRQARRDLGGQLGRQPRQAGGTRVDGALREPARGGLERVQRQAGKARRPVAGGRELGGPAHRPLVGDVGGHVSRPAQRDPAAPRRGARATRRRRRPRRRRARSVALAGASSARATESTGAGAARPDGRSGRRAGRPAFDAAAQRDVVHLGLQPHGVDAVRLPLFQRPVARNEAAGLRLQRADRLGLRRARRRIDEVGQRLIHRLADRLVQRPFAGAGGVAARRRAPGRRRCARPAPAPARPARRERRPAARRGGERRATGACARARGALTTSSARAPAIRPGPRTLIEGPCQRRSRRRPARASRPGRRRRRRPGGPRGRPWPRAPRQGPGRPCTSPPPASPRARRRAPDGAAARCNAGALKATFGGEPSSSQSANETSSRTTAPPFDWYWMSAVRARPSARSTRAASSLRPLPSGRLSSAPRSRASAVARARRTAPGRDRSTLGMRRSAAAPALAASVPALQSMVTPSRVDVRSAVRLRARLRARPPARAGSPPPAARSARGARGYSHSIVAGGFDEMS